MPPRSHFTAAETGVALDVLKCDHFDVIVDIGILDTTTGDETYVLTVETDSELAFGDAPISQATLTATATGRHVMSLNRDGITKLDPNATHVRIKATLAGTTPILDYGAHIVPA